MERASDSVCTALRACGDTLVTLPSTLIAGGGVVTNDDRMGEQLALLRDHGRNSNGEVVAWGTNSRLDNIQAAILNVKFKTFDKDLATRRSLAALYDEGLRDLSELLLPPIPLSSSTSLAR